MAVLTDVTLVADGGDITAGRKTSTLTFGEFNVVLPEDVQQRDERDGRVKDGYVYRPDGEFAPFDIGFARADVTVDLQAQTSDLEAVVDAAQKQSDGDVFFERDITIVGLGGFVPGVDFQVGDIVTVELWGGLVRLALPVTDITLISSDSEGVIAWRVHVGGMLISDLAELRRSNEELRRQVKSDGRSISQARSDASSAKSTADTARSVAEETKRTVEDAEGVIQSALDEAAAAEERGRGYAQEAYESYEKARGSYLDALGALDDMERLLGESDSVLQENEQLAQDIRQIHSQVSVLGAQVRVASQQMGALLGSVSGNVALSLQYSEEAREAVDDAAELRKQVEGLVLEAQDAISEGRKHVQSALSHSQSAAQAVSDAQAQAQKAKAEADRAVQTLDDVKSVKAGADSAAKAAGERLADLQREAEEALSKIDAKQNEILALHQEVLEKHGEVLTAHETAIRAVAEGVKAAGAAAGSASMGAMWAQLTAEDAARAAESALDAAEKNEESIRLLAEAQEKLEEASRKLAAANDENAKAIATLKDAQKLQDKINQDLVAADEKLRLAQEKLEAQTANLKKAVELTNQAVRAVGAAAGFAAQTGMHAADVGERATKTAESALEAYGYLREALDAAENSRQSREETLAVQQFYTGQQALLTQGMVYWTREQRTRVYSHSGPGVKTHEGGLLKTWDYNEQRGFSFEAVGNWWGKVTFQIEFKGGTDSAVDLHTYNVVFDKRSTTFHRGAVHMAFMNAHMQVEVWKPNNATFYLPVDTETGRITSVDAYLTPAGNPFRLHSDGSIEVGGIKAGLRNVEKRVVGGVERFYPVKQKIPGTSLSVWPAYIEVNEVG